MFYFCDLLCMILHTVNLQSPRELCTYMYLFNFSGYQIILLVATYLFLILNAGCITLYLASFENMAAGH